MKYIVSTSFEELYNANKQFYQHVHENLLIPNEKQQHLPIPIYSFLTPMMSLQFLNHIMLLFEVYEKELGMSIHVSIGENVWNKKIIGMNYDEEYLQIYSNEFCNKYINEQVRFYPNSMNVLLFYNIGSGSIFNIVLVKE